tara:strand:+ start:717 stop:872 length:156 start_codon:yes stop_codon:yes gene_type:complete
MGNKLRNLKGSKGQIKIGGKMDETLKKLGITADQLLRMQAKKKKKNKMTIG